MMSASLLVSWSFGLLVPCLVTWSSGRSFAAFSGLKAAKNGWCGTGAAGALPGCLTCPFRPSLMVRLLLVRRFG